MLEMLDRYSVELLAGIGVPAVGAMFFVARHFWIKTKCFYLLKQRVEHQEKATEQGQKEHEKMFNRLNDLDRRMSALQAQNEIILKKLT